MNFLTGTLSTLSLLALSAVILLNGLLTVMFLVRKNENKRADLYFSALLLSYALTCFHHVLILKGSYLEHPRLLFAPLYFTLAFGMLLFYSIKLRLFPGYRFIGTDLKHFILPALQFLYFLGLFLFSGVDFRQTWGRRFYSPFYGGLEMALYIATFYAYQFAAYRYIRYKISALRKGREGGKPLYEALVFRRMLRVLIILFWINSAYIAIDFIMYELLRLNMHDFKGFTRFGELSFAAIAGWIGLTGLQLLAKPPYFNLSQVVFSWLKDFVRKQK